MDERTPVRGRQESLHEQAERIAVSQLDWVMVPIEGVFQAVASLAHPHLPHPHLPHFHLPSRGSRRLL